MLLRSFSKSARPEELRPPAWDVALVLQSLTRALYEPLQTSDECFLAQKTLFLLALASVKQVGEFHALSYSVSHSGDWGEVSFTFVPGFVAKTQDPSSSAPRFEGFTVPALPNLSTNRNGRLHVLCRRSGVTWTVPLHIACDVSGCSSPQDVARRRSQRTRSPSGDDFSGVQAFGEALTRATPESQGDPGCHSVSSVQEEPRCRIGVEGGYLAQIHHLYAPLPGDLAHRSLETFHLGPVVAEQALV